MTDAFAFLGRAVQAVLTLFDNFVDGLGAWPYILFGIILTMVTGSILIPMLSKPSSPESNKRGRDNE